MKVRGLQHGIQVLHKRNKALQMFKTMKETSKEKVLTDSAVSMRLKFIYSL